MADSPNSPAPAPNTNAQLKNGTHNTKAYADPTATHRAASTPTEAATGKNFPNVINVFLCIVENDL